MLEDEFNIPDLLLGHFNNELTKEKQELLDSWLASSPANRELMEMLRDPERFAQAFASFLRIDSAQAWATFQRQKGTHGAWWKIVIGFVGVGTLILCIMLLPRHFSTIRAHPMRPLVHETLAPPGHFATLQLPDRSSYELAACLPGPVRTIGCITICKCTDSTVAYLPKPGCMESHPPAHQSAYNTLSTPGGGRYTAILQDNSQVRLNAASTLCFPTRFDSLHREVYLQGEGYFNVTPARVKGRSRGYFIVHVGMLNIVSLGTRFNVKAYPGTGSIRVDLDEDSLRLDLGGYTLTLHSGEAAIVDENGVLRRDSGVVAAGTSWKKGEFIFGGQSLVSILTELSRWYDARIAYIGDKPAGTYTLKGQRNQQLGELLGQLEKQGHFHYKIKADTVYIFNQSKAISIKP